MSIYICQASFISTFKIYTFYCMELYLNKIKGGEVPKLKNLYTCRIIGMYNMTSIVICLCTHIK